MEITMSNIDKIKHAMPEHNCDAMLIINEANRLYATGFSSSAGVLLVSGDSAWFFVDSRYKEAAESSVKDAQIVEMTNEKDAIEKLL